MNALSVILAMAFLGLLVLVGGVLFWVGARKLRREMAQFGGPHVLIGVAGVSMRVLLIAAGVTLAAYGIVGTYRVIWGF